MGDLIIPRYNKVEGVQTSETPLLEEVIGKEWGYDGAIQSDWFGTVSTVNSILAGQDLEMPGPSIFRGNRLLDAINRGEVTEAQIDQRARKMPEWIHKVTGPERKPVLTTEEVKSVARKVALEGIVLLKNENDALSLGLTGTTKLAIIGLPAIDPPVGGDGSSLAPPQYVLKPLEFIQKAHPEPEPVRFAGGVKYNKISQSFPKTYLRQRMGERG
jgi:beta-glucosidase